MAKPNDTLMFLLLYAHHAHLKLYKFEWNTFPNNMPMNNRTDGLFIY